MSSLRRSGAPLLRALYAQEARGACLLARYLLTPVVADVSPLLLVATILAIPENLRLLASHNNGQKMRSRLRNVELAGWELPTASGAAADPRTVHEGVECKDNAELQRNWFPPSTQDAVEKT